MSVTFSIVITSYNYRRFLGEAIDSALAQSHPAAQVIVVDDGSTDDSAALVRERCAQAPTLQLIEQDNLGQLGAFIAGVAASRGDAIAFLDADDAWDADHLQRLDAAYGGAGAPDAVHTNLRRFGAAEGLWHTETDDRDLGLTALPTYARLDWYGSPTSGLSMRRALAQAVLDLPTHWLADWRSRADDVLVFGSSLLLAHKHFLAHPSVRYRVHADNRWYGRAADPVADLRYAYRREALVRHYAACAGLGVHSLRKAREEFETRPRPTRAEARLYSALAWQAPASIGKRLELLFGIWRHARRRAQPAQPT